MSNYEIGKDVQHLTARVEELEKTVEDLIEFYVCGELSTEDAIVDAIKDTDPVRSLRYITYSFGHNECHAMLHKGSTLKVWENGSWESSCTLEDRSRHSKWGNWVFFYVGAGSGDIQVQMEDPWAWIGNFGPGETKTYGGRGSEGGLASRFQKLWDNELSTFRRWRCWRR